MRRAARVDENQGDIVAHFRAMGASVRVVSMIPGALDLIVGYKGRDCRVEIKDGAKPPSARKLTDAEDKEISEWKGRKPAIVCNFADAERLLSSLLADSVNCSKGARY